MMGIIRGTSVWVRACVYVRAREPHPAMLLVEMLLERLLCVLKDRMLGFLRGNCRDIWSSGLASVDQRSRVSEEEDDVEMDEFEDVAGETQTNKQEEKQKHISRLHSGGLVQFQCNPNGDE